MILVLSHKEAGAQHRGQGQTYDDRYANRRRHRDGEFTKQPPDDAAHQQERDEDGNQRDADGKHGEADLARAVERRAHRRRSGFDMAVDVFRYHDGVVDYEADRDGHRHQ